MEESYYQNYQPSYQKSPCPSERRNDISPDIEHTNDVGYIDVSPSNRALLHHSLSYPPASGRSLHSHKFQAAQPRSRLQTISSPPTSGITSSSPELPSTALLDSASSPSSATTTTLSSFPLPYRSQSATYYRSPPTDYPPTTFPLTSQDFRPYHSSSTQVLPGSFSSPDNLHSLTNSAALPGSQNSDPNSGVDYFSSATQNWQTRDSKWPRSRSQSSRKYVPKGRRYDQRRVAPRNGFLRPAKKYHLPGPSNQSVGRKVQDGQKRRISPSNDDSATRSNDDTKLPEGPRLVNYALPASLDDEEKEEKKPSFQQEIPMSVSRYVSPNDDEDDSVQSIRKSQYWTQLKHDPIFSDLSHGSETISITDLRQRRDQILHNRASPPRQAIVMKEQGTQTDPEELPFPQAPSSPPSLKATTQSKEEFSEQQLTTSRPKSVPHSRKRPHAAAKERNQIHHRTSSLTDTDSPRINHTQQQANERRGFKRSRSVTEEDYEERSDYFLHRRKVGGGFNQGSFYRR